MPYLLLNIKKKIVEEKGFLAFRKEGIGFMNIEPIRCLRNLYVS